jgi:hypothetical protein
MDIFADGKVISMDDFKSLTVFGGKHKGWSSQTVDKGQFKEIKLLAASLLQGEPWPITLEEQFQATRISFAVEQQLQG